MPPFVKQLSACLLQFSTKPTRADFCGIEFITALHGFVVNGLQVCHQHGGWIPRFGKPNKLRVMPIAACRAAQNFLRQQRFTPERHQTPASRYFGCTVHKRMLLLINPATRAIAAGPRTGQSGSAGNRPNVVSTVARGCAICASLRGSHGGNVGGCP